MTDNNAPYNDGDGDGDDDEDNTCFLSAYTDRLSGQPGETIRFYVSSKAQLDYSTCLVRSISSDPNPDGPGMIEQNADEYYRPTTYPSRYQSFRRGSYAMSENDIVVIADADVNEAGATKIEHIEFRFWMYPMAIPYTKPQNILSWGPISISLNRNGYVEVYFGEEDHAILVSSDPLRSHQWYECRVTLLDSKQVVLHVRSQNELFVIHDDAPAFSMKLDLIQNKNKERLRLAPHGSFNGKLECPQMTVNDAVVADWDFASSSHDMSSFSIPPATHHDDDNNSHLGAGALVLYNAPMRAAKGHLWDGSEFCYKHQPAHYAAIRFHDDDVYDFHWKCDFEWTIPAETPSGVYLMRIEVDGHKEALPLFIRPPPERRRAPVCLLIPTFTYVIYGNHARADFELSWLDRIKANPDAYQENHPSRYPQYGCSTYNYHSDGRSGICYASHHRPLFNVRPGYITFGYATCSGLRHFPADSHLIAWFHRNNIEIDIITDHDLHCEGYSALEGYKVVSTGSHPEYHTKQTLDALQQYRDNGGNLAYLGGNGFYWRIACHPKDPSLLEIRRCEDGVRVWESEPGEYYHAFDGCYGGLWRRNGRPPQQLVGVGFTAQGHFNGMPYQRTCHDVAFDWVFDGIEDETRLGDFGFSGHGAAGFELDRTDPRLDGGIENLTMLAQSVQDSGSDGFMLVPEEVLTHFTNTAGLPEDQVKRADMVYFRTPSGGQVFSVGSITFCGSLPWNDFDNNISTLLRNVMRRFMEDEEA